MLGPSTDQGRHIGRGGLARSRAMRLLDFRSLRGGTGRIIAAFRIDAAIEGCIDETSLTKAGKRLCQSEFLP
jgi:hypothetical protein